MAYGVFEARDARMILNHVRRQSSKERKHKQRNNPFAALKPYVTTAELPARATDGAPGRADCTPYHRDPETQALVERLDDDGNSQTHEILNDYGEPVPANMLIWVQVSGGIRHVVTADCNRTFP